MSEQNTGQNVLVVVQCRHDSRRLPGKALLPLGGVPMLEFLLLRLECCANREGVLLVLATTDRAVDDAVAAVGRRCGVSVVRGETHDLLARYRRCLDAYPAGHVVRVTADNPLTCPEMLNACLDILRDSDPDYLAVDGMPRGAAVDAFAARTIDLLCDRAKDPEEREHINLYVLRNPGEFFIKRVRAPEAVNRPELSLTVDTPKDYERLAVLFSSRDQAPWSLPLSEAIMRVTRKISGETAWPSW